MPIPFRDAEDIEEMGTVGYLTVAPHQNGNGFDGALFLMNMRGEPIEFTYNRIEMPNSFLWRKEDILRSAQRRLAASLLSICPVIPKIIICLAEEIGCELFCQDIKLSMPVCRIAPSTAIISFAGAEIQETTATTESLNLFWYPDKPIDSTPERQLINELARRGLLMEPFDRAKNGLGEVCGRSQGSS